MALQMFNDVKDAATDWIRDYLVQALRPLFRSEVSLWETYSHLEMYDEHEKLMAGVCSIPKPENTV